MLQTHLLSFLGLCLLFSLLTGKVANYLKVPIIIGYIITGAIFGPGILHFISAYQVEDLSFINLITLSLIGFNIGSELRFKELQKMGKMIIIIVIFEASLAFLVTAIATALVLKSIPMGIIYGALACATAPAGTIDVIRQYQAKGVLTSTLFAVMGLDDIFALIVYSLGVPIAGIMLGSHDVSISFALLGAFRDIMLEVFIGAAFGYLLSRLGRYIHEQSLFLIYSLGSLFVMCSLAQVFDISPILLTMSAAIVMTNTNGIVTKKFTHALTQWSPPVYLMFFVLLGSRLDFKIMASFAVLIIVYIVSRSLGKFGGSYYGARIAGADPRIRKYLGFTLLSQAGVAIGLSLGAAKILTDMHMNASATQIISVMTASTFLIMLIGPILVKYGLGKAGELRIKD
ncbi:MAG: cation:proton antiporter [Candidatus Cloacimonetes bacterium]|nr:cation:proton antiporter [Candidatus Cloacimonadota bacterium]